jgi:hypothetical protein
MVSDVSWKVDQVKEYYDRIAIAYIFDEGLYGTVEKLGVYASVVKYTKDNVEVEELLDNEDFVIVDEIVFEHIEEEN